MKDLPGKTREFRFGDRVVKIQVPAQPEIREQFRQQVEKDAQTPFPYWAKIWPSAIALAGFIEANPEYVKDRRVLELAAGLALPSLVAADKAREVIASDYLAEALDYIRHSAILNRYTNCKIMLINWHAIPPETDPDLVIMSDVNYETGEFEQLIKVIHAFLEKHIKIILSTPQRLVAKEFIAALLPYCIYQETVMIEEEGNSTAVSILVLGT
ncbi:class I SAM-dependent methyltransferase [Flavihumibacter stibioxidans]|uniref:Methyltransferase n=1 Tax=Flavihumibacter stibioxidans TaxID=1834163 RepID=A0ABR7M740_9BACT|nr:methyltransferase [Flavihumibacter stibioxidans]MBC6490344.1 hypothetical protein [Flavihumibacter stibioxidans]